MAMSGVFIRPLNKWRKFQLSPTNLALAKASTGPDDVRYVNEGAKTLGVEARGKATARAGACDGVPEISDLASLW